MKKLNLFAMGLLATAAVSFTACSSNDDLNANGTGSSESKANGFYMTLTVQTPTSNGSRTSGTPTEAGTEPETTVTTGTLYLVDQNGKTVFSKNIEKEDWNSQPGGNNPVKKDGTLNTVKLEVNLVTAGQKYNVYFLANKNSTNTPWVDEVFQTETATGLTAATKFSNPFSTDNAFVMFNQNDPSHNGKLYSVTFTDDNKVSGNPAKVVYANGNDAANIKLDRIVARIDQPTSEATVIAENYPGEASDTYKEQMKKAHEVVESIALQKYAISNMPNSTYAMQHWTGTAATDSLVIPSNVTYQQDYASFGDETTAAGLDQFENYVTSNVVNHYVLENLPAAVEATTPTARDHKRTAMYFEYKVTLKSVKFSDGDIKDTQDKWDGTFYRYNGVIYTKLADIYTAYNQVAGWGKLAKLTADTDGTYTPSTNEVYANADAAVVVLKAILSSDKNNEANLSALRKAWGIEVFRQGLCYYKQIIQDQNYKYQDANKNDYYIGAVHRNSIYKLNVKNIYNIGADVPNGTPTENAVYYMSAGVEVNDWVLSEQEVVFH